MSNLLSVWVIVPAYQEDALLPEVLRDLFANRISNVVVVDDGSPVSLQHCVQNFPVHFLRHCINQGQGAALRTGIEYALARGAEILVTFDADGQHQAGQIPLLIAPIQQGRCEVALGSRFLSGGAAINAPALRLWLLKAAILFTRLTTGLSLSDTHNGFRALSRSAVCKISLTQRRMGHASQIISEIAKHSIPFEEVPVTIRYTDYSLKKGQGIRNFVEIFGELLDEWLFGE